MAKYRFCRCGAIVDGKCERCSKQDTKHPGGTTDERGYDYQWKKLRLRKLSANPLCEECEANDRTTAATEVHHVAPIRTAPEKRLSWSNLMSVCHPCHVAVEARTGGPEATGTGGSVKCPKFQGRDHP